MAFVSVSKPIKVIYFYLFQSLLKMKHFGNCLLLFDFLKDLGFFKEIFYTSAFVF